MRSQRPARVARRVTAAESEPSRFGRHPRAFWCARPYSTSNPYCLLFRTPFWSARGDLKFPKSFCRFAGISRIVVPTPNSATCAVFRDRDRLPPDCSRHRRSSSLFHRACRQARAVCPHGSDCHRERKRPTLQPTASTIAETPDTSRVAARAGVPPCGKLYTCHRGSGCHT